MYPELGVPDFNLSVAHPDHFVTENNFVRDKKSDRRQHNDD